MLISFNYKNDKSSKKIPLKIVGGFIMKERNK